MIQFGRYENLKEVGSGGFATVYKAHDPKLKRIVALKVLHTFHNNNFNLVDRFLQEAQTVARLSHPNIITIHDYGEEERRFFIAMEYLSGGDLQEWLNQKGGAFTVEETISILKPIAKALDYAHDQGIVHRDVKPSNMMIQQIGKDRRIVLTDFGLVKAMEESLQLTTTGSLLGSPEYMAPEQADPNRYDEIGSATDLYAFGIVAYQMMVGRVPFPGNTHSTLNAHENKSVPAPHSINRNLPVEIANILIKMLSKSPMDRYHSATLFIEALEAAVKTKTEAQELETRITPLYEQLLAEEKSKNWLGVMEIATQIDVLQPNYRNVPALRNKARHKLQSPEKPKPDIDPSQQDTPSLGPKKEKAPFRKTDKEVQYTNKPATNYSSNYSKQKQPSQSKYGTTRANAWWLLFIEGLVLGFIAVWLYLSTDKTTLIAVQIIGIYWGISGVIWLVDSYINSSNQRLKLFAGLIAIFAGSMTLLYPFYNTIIVLGSLIIMLGIFSIFYGLICYKGARSGARILGILNILFGTVFLGIVYISAATFPYILAILSLGFSFWIIVVSIRSR